MFTHPRIVWSIFHAPDKEDKRGFDRRLPTFGRRCCRIHRAGAVLLAYDHEKSGCKLKFSALFWPKKADFRSYSSHFGLKLTTIFQSRYSINLFFKKYGPNSKFYRTVPSLSIPHVRTRGRGKKRHQFLKFHLYRNFHIWWLSGVWNGVSSFFEVKVLCIRPKFSIFSSEWNFDWQQRNDQKLHFYENLLHDSLPNALSFDGILSKKVKVWVWYRVWHGTSESQYI